MNDLVDVVLGNEQTFQQMRPLLGFFQVIPGAPGEDFFLMLQVLVDDLPQGENFRLLLVVHQRQHDNAEAGLQGRLLEQIVQHDLRIGVLFQLDDNAHTVAVGLVPEVGNAVQTLVLHLLGNVLDELTLVDLIGKLGDDDPHPVFAVLLKLRPGADDHLATAGGVGRANAAASHNDAAGREVGAGNMLHQVSQGRFRVVQHAHAGVDDLRQVVGRDVGRHADSDAGGTVDQQVGEAGGKYTGFLPGLVEVGVPVHGVLVDVPEHFVGNFA